MDFPFGPSAPDLTAADGAPMHKNVLPAKDHYKPVADISAYTSDGLTARCQGGAFFRDSAGNVHGFAGDATKLYHITAGATTWTNVSKVAGYTTATDAMWCFVQYLDKVYATNFTDAIQVFDLLSSSVFADLSASAPKCRYLLVVKNFLVALNTNDASDGNVPNRVWWSKQNDPSSWPTPGSAAAIAALSDKRDLSAPKGTGWIYGGGAGLAAADGLILTENGLWRMLFSSGSDQIFTFDQMEGARGTRIPGAIVQHGSQLDFIAEDGLYTTDGATAQNIGASIIDKFFYGDATHGVDQTNLFRVSAINDPINKIIMIGYPSVSGGGGSIDRILVRNWETGGYSLITGLASLDVLVELRSLGYSIDTLDTLSSSVDALPYSLDSRQLTGGLPLFGAFKASDHKLYTFTGSNLAATLFTVEAAHPTGQRYDPVEIWPQVEGTSATITATMLTRSRLNDAQMTGSAIAQNSTGFCGVRTNARFQQCQVDIAAAGTWTKAIGVKVPDDRIALKGGR